MLPAALPVALVLSLPADVADKPAAGVADSKPDLVLELSAVSATVKAGAAPVFKAQLVNRGKTGVTLVKPGDGSEVGWRTPITTWTVTPNLTKRSGIRCGNMNALKPDEIFELKPGERFDLAGWIGGPNLPKAPGKYLVTFRYRNDPAKEFSKRGLANHDPAALKRVAQSTAVDLESNAVEIVVEE